MKKYEIIYVVVVYRNTEDLISLIQSINKFNSDFKIIVVNNYYDDESMKKCQKIALDKDCDFINVPNGGYGFGNNRGIEYANQNYDYNFIIISNPDIEIKKFNVDEITKFDNLVLGPIITTKMGKYQNPYWLFNNRTSEWLIYKGYLIKERIIVYLGIALNKVIREIFLKYFIKSNKKQFKVFALHGSFVIFSKKVIKKIGLPYDEEMFLFAEEAYLAHLLKRHGVISHLTKSIEVLHKEDGSMSVSDNNEKNEVRKSIMVYYPKVKKKEF